MQIGSTAANTVTYKLNALGQRVQKTGAGTYVYSTSTTINGTTGLSPQALTLNFNARYVYDEQGRLLGEYSPDGKLIAETIWLDDLPVATIRPKNASNQLPLGTAGTGAATANNTGANTAANPVNVDLYYLHPDHLGTPRVATRSVAVRGAATRPNAVNKAVWRWDSDPFGTSLDNSKPNENPQQVTGTQTQIQAASFKVNNRFPGQVFDAETSKSYNYFRDYDPSIGRYVESDPIGLRGGLNTYGYVDASPVKRIDPLGLMGFGGGAQPGPRGPMKCDVMCVFESKPDCRGDAQCEAANRAAGIRSSTETKYYGCACVLSLGLLGKGGLAYANSKVISAVATAAQGGKYAGAAATGELLLNGPIGIGLGIVVGLAELAAKCEVRPTDNCCR